MKRFVTAIAILMCSGSAALAQSDAFVPQLATQSGAQVRQGNMWSGAQVQQGATSSGAFVGQLPQTARPHVVAASPAPARASYVHQSFISQPAHASAGDEPLVIQEDAGVVGYGEAPRPVVPTIGTGVSVVLTLPARGLRLPDIGSGAVVL